MGKAARFMTSLRMRLTTRGRKQSDSQTGKKSRIVSWFSTSDLDHVTDHSGFLLDDSGLDITPSTSTSPQSFMTSLMSRLKSRRGRKKTTPGAQKKRRSGVVSWFSTSDLDFVEEQFLLEDSGLDVTSGRSTPAKRNRDSGYVGRFSGHEDARRSWILEDKVCLDLERGEVTPYFDLQEETIRKAESVSSLLRCTSIQDKSLKVTRKRRQNVAKRNRRNKYSSFKKAIFPDDEGIDMASGDCTTDDSCDEMLAPPSVKKSSPTEVKEVRSAENITRQNSVQKKSWEIRRRRKQELQKKRRSANLETVPAAREGPERSVSGP